MHVAATVLVDTGPLVALFDPSDAGHEGCRRQLGELRLCELVTTLAVVTEATYLLGFSVEAMTGMLAFIAAGAVRIEPIDGTDLRRCSQLIDKYADLPMDFADATLVVLAERLACMRIFTLDHRDFRLYRVGRRAFRVLPE